MKRINVSLTDKQKEINLFREEGRKHGRELWEVLDKSLFNSAPKTSEKKPQKNVSKEKIYYGNTGDTERTVDAWEGGESYEYMFKVELFGFRVVLWRHKK